jgi:hypothetical protein
MRKSKERTELEVIISDELKTFVQGIFDRFAAHEAFTGQEREEVLKSLCDMQNEYIARTLEGREYLCNRYISVIANIGRGEAWWSEYSYDQPFSSPNDGTEVSVFYFKDPLEKEIAIEAAKKVVSEYEKEWSEIE